jgi:pSer/pThr/pTyr-binding forkhead associated (FHA) protein
MEVKLIVAKGKHAGKEVPVAKPKFVIGRAEDCHLRPFSELVSRHHCAIIADDGPVAVRDFGSKNGTFVNGDRVEGEKELKNGDRLVIGNLEFEVQVSVAVGGARKPKVESVQQAAARTVESGVDELDLDNWLRETRTSDSAQDTDTVAAPSDTDDSDQEGKPQKADVVGVYHHGRWKPTAANPRDAAADTLKNFFKRS